MTFTSQITKDGALLLERTAPISTWRPAVGEAFYKPDMNSSRQRCDVLVWQDSEADAFWLALKRVFRTAEEALEEWHVQTATAWYLAAE